MHKSNLVYFGSPTFAADILSTLITSKLPINISAVVTQPDKKFGRKQTLTASPVAEVADKFHLPVFKPHKLDSDNLAHIKLLKPDIFLVVAFGKIIPIDWLNAPKIGTYNIHFSLLPKYRGALCVSEAIKNQDQFTGVTLMEMEEGLDSGPIISQTNLPIEIDDNIETLTTKLTQQAIDLLLTSLGSIADKSYSKSAQNNQFVVTTPLTKTHNKDNAFIAWTKISQASTDPKTALQIHALIRSNSPEPGAWTIIDNQKINILKTSIKNDILSIDLIQIPGKNPVTWKQYLNGHRQSQPLLPKL